MMGFFSFFSQAKSSTPVKSELPNHSLDTLWVNIHVGVYKVLHNASMSRCEYMELYNQIYLYCSKENSPFFNGCELYGKLEQFLKKHLESLSKETSQLSDEDLLRFYIKSYEQYCCSIRILNGLFAYLNRKVNREHLEGNKQRNVVHKLGLILWREVHFNSIKALLTGTMLKLVEKERNGHSINTSLFSSVINNYVELGFGENNEANLSVYKESFEAPFLSAIEQYYKLKSDAFLAVPTNSVIDYAKKVLDEMKDEKKRAMLYVHASTLEGLAKCCNYVLESHLDKFCNEFDRLLSVNARVDLIKLHSLLAGSKICQDGLKSRFEAHILTQGLDAIKGCGKTMDADPKLYVEAILAVHKKFASLVAQSFGNDPGFVAALDKACQKFINHNSTSGVPHEGPSAEEHVDVPVELSESAKMLAKFCDQILKKGTKNLDDNEIESKLNDAIIVFKYLTDKDVFEKFYSKLLAKRLVDMLSVSDDAEIRFISKLNQICGIGYTSKLQIMFQDICLSKDLNIDFRKYLASSAQASAPKLDTDFTVHILRTGAWPIQMKPFSLLLPAELDKCISRYTEFYNEKYHGRKLNWLHNLSKGELCFKKRYIIQASTFQMAILLQFNTNNVFTVQQLCDATQLDMDMLVPMLQVLVKARLLLVTDALDTNLTEIQFAPSTRVQLFEEYNNKKVRLNINVPLKTKIKSEMSDMIKRQVEEDRSMTIQAALVRIMKMRRTLKHAQLVTEVIGQLSNRFQPNVNDIKKCIDILVMKEYLKKAENDQDTYQYLA